MSFNDIRSGLKSSSHLTFYKAVVVDNDDQLKQGRIKCIIPELADTEVYCLPCLIGESYFVPENNATVLVYADNDVPGIYYYLAVLPNFDANNEYSNRINLFSNFSEFESLKQSKLHIQHKSPLSSEYWADNSVEDCYQSETELSLKKSSQVSESDKKVIRVRQSSLEIESNNSSSTTKILNYQPDKSDIYNDRNSLYQGSSSSYHTDITQVNASSSVRNIKLKSSHDITVSLDSQSGTIIIQVNNTKVTVTQSGDVIVDAPNSVTVNTKTATVNANTTTINSTTTINGNTTVNGSLNVNAGGASLSISSGGGSMNGNFDVSGNINATGSIMDQGGNSNHHRH